MRIEDFKKLATGPILFDLNRIITPRIVTILYFLGLAAILLWAINHFFYSFAFGFGNGLWGLLEIAVFGLLALVVLRIVCEAVIVFFKAHRAEAAATPPARHSASLIDDVRDAIEDLADQEPDAPQKPETPPARAQPAPPPATRPAAAAKPAAPRKTGAAAKTGTTPRKRARPAKPKTDEPNT